MPSLLVFQHHTHGLIMNIPYFNRGRQPFSCGHYLVGTLVLPICVGHYALDYAQDATHRWLHNSAVVRQCGDLGNNKLSPILWVFWLHTDILYQIILISISLGFERNRDLAFHAVILAFINKSRFLKFATWTRENGKINQAKILTLNHGRVERFCGW